MASSKYKSPLTAKLTLDNWQDHIKPDQMSRADMLDLWGDCKKLEKLGKQLGGFLKEVLLSQLPEGEDYFESDYFLFERKFGERVGTFNKERFIEEYGEDVYYSFLNDPTETITCYVKELED